VHCPVAIVDYLVLCREDGDCPSGLNEDINSEWSDTIRWGTTLNYAS